MRHFLKDTILDKITIDHFSPKSGTEEEIIVVAFYAVDKDPAHDLETFLQRSALEIVDVDVSPNPDEDGYYIVFVELEKDRQIVEKISFLIKDIENITGELDWKVKPYLAVDWYSLDDPEFLKYFIPKDSSEDITEFFSSVPRCNIVVEGHTLNMERLSAQIVNFGKFEELSLDKVVTESVSSMMNTSSEIRYLCECLGSGYEVSVNRNNIVVSNGTDILIIKDAMHKF